MNETNKRYILHWIKKRLIPSVLIFLGLTVVLLILEGAEADTIIVDDDGVADYSSIEYAIQNASAGDTIFVKAGVYSGHLVINKTLNLMGESPKNTRIFGEYYYSSILIEADYVNVSGLHVAYNRLGINLSHANHCNISNNFITESYSYGENTSGIKIENSHNNTLFNNTFYLNYLSAINLSNSNNNKILNNVFSFNFNHIYSNNSRYNIVNYNTFYEAFYFYVNNTDEEELNAQNNYWFTGDESLIAYMVNGNVNYQNWLDYDPTHNKAPVLVEGMPNDLYIDEGECNQSFLDLNDYFEDEFGYLNYDIVYNSEPKDIGFRVNLWHVLWVDASVSKWHGTVEVIISATDILDCSTNLTLFITVNDIYEPPEIEDVYVKSTRYNVEKRYLWKPDHMHEGDKLVIEIWASDDNRITKLEAKVDEGDWKVVFINPSEMNTSESIEIYFNWTVPRGGGGNHTFSFRVYDGVEYSNVTVREVNIVYLGDKTTFSDVVPLLIAIFAIMFIMIAVLLLTAYFLGRRGLRKNE